MKRNENSPLSAVGNKFKKIFSISIQLFKTPP